MATLPTIPNVIVAGEISTYMSANETDKNVLFPTVSVPPNPVEIAMFTDILYWHYSSFPNDTTLRGTSNYAIWLFGKYWLRSQAVTGGGGSVIPITPGSGPTAIQFKVDANSPIPTGGTTLTLPPEWTGYDILFTRDGFKQYKIDVGGTFYSYDIPTRLLTCSAASAGELFGIDPIL
jgi:hypothetical protein